jgi:seryl-tRNA synthetase
MTNCAEEVLKRLGLAYRVVLSTGDMGFGTEDVDLEVWLPDRDLSRDFQLLQGAFQAQRMKGATAGRRQARCRCTLNGSGLAIGGP